MRGSIVVAVVVISAVAAVVLFAIPASAQTRTIPPALDFTCHGYNEAQRGTRAYNCIPKTESQPHMRTFVPAPGSACDAGMVNEFPPGRIVFQIRCQDAGAPPPPPADFEIRRVRRYKSALHVSHWLYFDIVGGKALPRFTINVRLHYADRTFLSCDETVYGGLEKGQVKEGLVIPSVCGPDVEWVAAEFRPTAGMTCQGCGKYEFGNIPVGRAVPPGSTDSALELELVLEDYQLADVRRRVDR